MSAWIERILREFPADLARFWIACDPNDLLLDERILHSLRERGFEVLSFEDSIAFRAEYEERYRAAWDRGEKAPTKALILHLREPDVDRLPWDYLRQARQVSVSLADLIPRLSYNVIRHIGSEYREALYEAEKKQATESLGENSTKDFILTHVFQINPHLISETEDLWRELLKLYYKNGTLPPLLSEHMARSLKANPNFRELPLEELFSSESYLLRYLQQEWERFIRENMTSDNALSDTGVPHFRSAGTVPFTHSDVRAIVDSLFLDGALQPVSVDQPTGKLPKWIKVGIAKDPDAHKTHLEQITKRTSETIPGQQATHLEWQQFARRLAEVIFRWHNLPQAQAEELSTQTEELQKDADRSFSSWVMTHVSNLASLPVAKSPAMVHHIPRYLALQRNSGGQRIALLVFDGLALDQWIKLREQLTERAPTLTFVEDTCFAWLPTLTSVSRQALFSGLKPREFAKSIDTTSRESALWSRFWQDNGLRKQEVGYEKAIQNKSDLDDLESLASRSSLKALGVVVDTVDEMVHGTVLGKRGISAQLSTWCETGFVEDLFRMLLRHGYQVYVTADHGNIDAIGIGRLQQGAISEMRGERVRVYRSESLANNVPEDIDAQRFDMNGLPSDFLPLYARDNGAFVQEGKRIVAHGGISLEELIVPFIKVNDLTIT